MKDHPKREGAGLTRREALLAAGGALFSALAGCAAARQAGRQPGAAAAQGLGPFPALSPPSGFRVGDQIHDLNRVTDGWYHVTHHQGAAYAIWREILLGHLPRRGSILVNLDCHIDAWLPIGAPNPADRRPSYDLLDDPALSVAQRLERLARFLDDHLDYASWLTPIIESAIVTHWQYVVPHRLSLEQAREQSVVGRWQNGWRDPTGLPEGLTPPQEPAGFVCEVVRLEGLPPAERFRGRPVILSLDLDYYSNRKKTFEFERRPPGPSPPGEIEGEIAATVKALAARGLTRPALIVTSSSPQWVPHDQIAWIRERLVAALRGRRIAPQPWTG